MMERLEKMTLNMENYICKNRSEKYVLGNNEEKDLLYQII